VNLIFFKQLIPLEELFMQVQPRRYLAISLSRFLGIVIGPVVDVA